MSLARSSLISYVTIGPRGPTCYRASQKNASGCQTMAAVETVQALSGRSKSAELTGSRYSFQQRDFGHPLRGFDVYSVDTQGCARQKTLASPRALFGSPTFAGLIDLGGGINNCCRTLIV
jgi:hypothetical protein